MFSSRHYPHISLASGLELILEGLEGHSQDLANYIDTELKIGHSNVAEELKAELQAKSSGIFMWVVLVVGILNKEFDRGRIHALRTRLRDIPPDLHDLFRDILTRDTRDRNELILSIQWVLFAKSPLKPEEFYHAILSGADPDSLQAWDKELITVAIINRFITDFSKGLVETTKSKKPVVQFIHESVRDFLLKHNGLQKIWPDLGDRLEGRSHEQLKTCCAKYVFSSMIKNRLGDPKTDETRTSFQEAFPFLGYARYGILHHANASAHHGIDQSDFVSSFDLVSWITMDNIMEKFASRHHKQGDDRLLYIVAENNMASLIKSNFSKSDPLDPVEERYDSPFFAAIATESTEAVLTFAELQQSQIVDSPTPFQELCRGYLEDP